MAIDALSILTLFAATIILGYVGILVFEKTRIPDVLWLMILGLLAGPVFNFVDKAAFIESAPLLSALALIIILFEAGLNMDFYKTLRGAPRGILIALINMFLAVFFVAVFSYFFLGLDVVLSIVMGLIVSGTSSIIVVSILQPLRIRENIKTILDIESVITDPFAIVIVIALLQTIISTAQINNTANVILSAFSIGAMIGLVVGVVWLNILDFLRGRPFDYMLTLALMFIMYVVVEIVGGSGAISALFFGLVLGNSHTFSEILRFSKVLDVDSVVKRFHEEVSFFIRSFFFVFIGVVATINQEYILYGLVISAIVIITRMMGTSISTIGMGLKRSEKNLINIMTPRGLSAAVMAQLPAVYGIANSSMFSDIAFMVILSTIAYTSLTLRFAYNPRKK